MDDASGYRAERDERASTRSLFCVLLTAFCISGCSHSGEGSKAASIAAQATVLFAQGNYEASLGQYEKLIEKEPQAADRVLFEMGILYAHPLNSRKNYQKALECFHKNYWRGSGE
jgi:tetratricopeptide (TPR) repeat protein